MPWLCYQVHDSLIMQEGDCMGTVGGWARELLTENVMQTSYGGDISQTDLTHPWHYCKRYFSSVKIKKKLKLKLVHYELPSYR